MREKRGSLTIWFSEEAIESWRAAPGATPGGQPNSSDLAITTALTVRTIFRQGMLKQVIGDGLRFHRADARATEVVIAVEILNRMLDLGRPNSVRSA